MSWTGDARASLPKRVSQRIAGRSLALVMGGLLVIAVLVWMAALQLPDGRLHVAFLDVGQGDAILITTPEGRQLLVDGGPNPTQLAWELGRQMPFWDHSLDLIVLTHPDADHMAGLIPLLERVHVERAVVSSQALNGKEALHWRKAVAASGVETVVAERGMRVAPGSGVWLQVLHPRLDDRSPMTPDNDDSIVLRLTYGATSVLLTGDVEATGERDLLASGQSLQANVLKVSHHGSGGATTAEFLHAVGPQVAVIQVGADNHFGHPSTDVLQRLAEAGSTVLRTDQDGTVVVVSDGQHLDVRTGGHLAGSIRGVLSDRFKGSPLPWR